MRNYLILFILSGLLWGSTSCIQQQVTSTGVALNKSQKVSSNSKTLPQTPKIVFVTIELTRDSSTNTTSAQVLQTQVVDGQLKKDYDLEAILVPNHLLCTFLDATKNPIKKAVVENPIKKRVEYVGDDGQFQSRWIAPPQGSFFIRTQWLPNIRYLSIHDIGKDLNLSELAIINIQN